MVRSRYDMELEELNLDLIRMGAMAEETIGNAMQALSQGDAKLAKQVIEEDDAVDAMARRIEGRSMKLIMRQQPVAKDLRSISAALKMITDIERICDQAADIAEIIVTLCKNGTESPGSRIGEMGKLAVEMVKIAVDSYVRQSESLAQNVIDMDDEQDTLFNIVKNELVDTAVQNRKMIDAAVDYLMIAKYLERISDHAENIADWTMFSITGFHKHERIL